MNKPSFLRTTLLAVAAGVLTSLAVPSQAIVITQDLDFAFGPIASRQGEGGTAETGTVNKSFSQFDPNLGTLTSARWELTSAFAMFGQMTVTPLSNKPTDQVSGALTLESLLTTPNQFYGGLPGTNGGLFSQHRQEAASCMTNPIAGPCTASIEIGGTFDGTIEATNLAELVGYGGFDQHVQAMVNLNVNPDGFGPVDYNSFGQVIWADRVDRGGVGRLRLVYEYEVLAPPTDVPEPSSVALVGLALAAMHRLRRTRQSSSATT